jgi:hypothetical protein
MAPTWVCPVMVPATASPLASSAQVAYKVLPPKMVGRWPTARSRITPPPTAVTTPSSSDGSQLNPDSSAFCAPTAAQQPGAGEGGGQVGGVGQRRRRALLKKDITDDPATQTGDDGQGGETDRVEPVSPSNRPAQDRIREHPDQVEHG